MSSIIRLAGYGVASHFRGGSVWTEIRPDPISVPILEALGQIDYRGWVSVEVFDYSPGIARLARETIEHRRECLES